MARMSQPEPPLSPEPSMSPDPDLQPDPAAPTPSPLPGPAPAQRRGGYRPANASTVVGWWAVTLVVGWLAAAAVGVATGAIALAVAEDSHEWVDLGSVILGLLAGLGTAYVTLVVGAVLLVRRFVPPELRTAGWTALLVAVLAAGAALLSVAVVHVDERGVLLTGVAVAAFVPVLVVARLPRA
jgi:hypothetical protein